MDVALCTLDNVVYSATQFANLNFGELSEKRRYLACPECQGPAFFRKATRNGRAACFGARPHQPNCSLAAQDETRIIDGHGDIADVINNPGERIVVDLDFGANQHVHAEPHVGAFHGRARAGIHIGNNNGNNARMHRRLSSLLRTLIEVPQFGNSNQILEIMGREIPVKDFFVPLLGIQNVHLNSLRGFWGMLSDIGAGQPGTVWLNSGGRGNISFCINEEEFVNVCHRFNIDDEEDFAGAYVLVIGEAKRSQNGKIYCTVDNQNMICIKPT